MANTNIILQKVFQKNMNQPILQFKEVPTVEDRKKRLRLAFEELCELSEAFGLKMWFNSYITTHAIKTHNDNINNALDTFIYNPIETLDALVDIEVINNGSILECGMQDVYQEAYEITHNNNMGKLHDTLEQAEMTVDALTQTGKEGFIIEETEDRYFVVKNAEGKIMKPFDFVKNDLSSLFK